MWISSLLSLTVKAVFFEAAKICWWYAHMATSSSGILLFTTAGQ